MVLMSVWKWPHIQDNTMRDPRKWIIAAILTVAFALCFPTIYYRQKPKSLESIAPQINLISLIKQVDPSVVYIETYSCEGYKMWSGSGVIISSDGLILTAGHVVRGVARFKIKLLDGRIFLTSKSFSSDVIDGGLIKIDAEKLPFSYLGNSDDLRKGERVFIIGSPFGYDLSNTVTQGIISGLERDIDLFGEKFVIQSDAQSWPGNSGGPMYNMRGQIMGISVGGYWGADGISVIMPSNICKLLIDIYRVEIELENAS